MGTEDSEAKHQEWVDEYFRSGVSEWRESYEEASVQGVIIQERRATVLAWIEELGLPPGERVLEAGCGAGLATVALAQRGYTVTAVDTVEGMVVLTLLQAVEAGVGHRITSVFSDLQRLSFSEESFRLALVGVIPWLHSPHKAVL